MKKRLFYISFAALLVAILAGCSKDDADTGAGGPVGLSSLELRLGSMTRAVDAAEPTTSGIEDRVAEGHRLTVNIDGQSAVYKYEDGKFVPDATELSFPGLNQSKLSLRLAPAEAATQDGTKEGLLAADELEFSDDAMYPQREMKNIILSHAKSLIQFDFDAAVTIDNGSAVMVDEGKAYNIPSTDKYQAIVEPESELAKIVFTSGGHKYVAEVLGGSTGSGRFEPNTRYTFSVSIDDTGVVLKLMLIEPWVENGNGNGSESAKTTFTVHGLESDLSITGTINYLSGFSVPMTRKSEKGFEVYGPKKDLVKSISFGASGPEILVGRNSGESMEIMVDAATLKINGLIYDDEKDAGRINIIGELRYMGDTFFSDKAVMITDLNFDGIVWKPIFTAGAPFLGDLDGNGKSIHNLTISSGSDIGLFATCSAGTIKDLTIASGTIGNSSSQRVGAFAGKMTNGKFINCNNHAEIISVGFAGGIVGASLGDVEITNCVNHGKVSSNLMYGGGITGGTDYGTVIKDCINKGEIWGAVVTGGIAGLNNGLVVNCRNEAILLGFSDGINASTLGGIVAYNYKGIVLNCENAGKMTGNGTVGGIVGTNRGYIYACVNSGAIEDKFRWTGGISGNNYSVIAGCYNKGSVLSTGIAGGITSENRIIPGEDPDVDPDVMVGIIKGSYNMGKISLTSDSTLPGTIGGIAANVVDKAEIIDCYCVAAGIPAVVSYTSSATSTYYEFSATNWPTDKPASFWGIGNDHTQGKVWADLGKFDATNPKYPELTWKANAAAPAPEALTTPKANLGTIEKFMEHCDMIATELVRM